MEAAAAASSAIQSPPPEVRRCFVLVSSSHEPVVRIILGGRRTGRHRVKSGRAIISPLAAFEVYIPSRHLRSLRDARREKRGTRELWQYQPGRRGGGEGRLASLSPLFVFLVSSSFLPLFHAGTAGEKRPRKGRREEGGRERERERKREKTRRESGWRGSACWIADSRGVGTRIKGAERLEGAPNYDVTDRTRRDQVNRIQK